MVLSNRVIGNRMNPHSGSVTAMGIPTIKNQIIL
jgi:hypothetical protein